jgi:hypothetical protein
MTSTRKAQIGGLVVGIGSFVATKNLMPGFSWWQIGLWQIVIQLSVAGVIFVLLEWKTIRKEVAEEQAKAARMAKFEPSPIVWDHAETSAQAHVWISVFAAEFVRTRTGSVEAADAALSELRKRPALLKKLDEALWQGGDIP